MEGILEAVYGKWAHLPWKNFQPVSQVYKVQPTFVVGEAIFIIMSIFALIHAWKRGRLHLSVWIATIITGCANDAIFMWLPFVDNFFHAQGTIMLTPRLPLYILCVYNVFMYYSVVSVFDLNLPLISEAALVGLGAEIIYAPYDIVGAKYLWWSWHDTDAPVFHRILGAPIGSTMWVITFCFCFSLLLNLCTSRRTKLSFARLAFTLIVLALFTTPLMMIQMGIYQVPFGVQGIPDAKCLALLVLVYAVLVLYGCVRRGFLSKIRAPAKVNLLLALGVNVYFALLVFLLVTGVPEAHVSTGVHQTVGPCGVAQSDLMGHPREQYLCPQNFQEDFSILCGANGLREKANLITASNENRSVEWYTICGNPHSPEIFNQMVITLTGLALVGISLYTYLYSSPPKKLQTATGGKAAARGNSKKPAPANKPKSQPAQSNKQQQANKNAPKKSQPANKRKRE